MTGVESPNLLGPKSFSSAQERPLQKAITSSKCDIDFVR